MSHDLTEQQFEKKPWWVTFEAHATHTAKQRAAELEREPESELSFAAMAAQWFRRKGCADEQA